MTSPSAPRPAVTRRADCRLCGSDVLSLAFSLGSTPPANAFVPPEARHADQESFPLDVHRCDRCGHVQLPDVVDPDILFRDYVYVSSTSPSFVDHFRHYAEAVLDLTGATPGSLAVEIGSNDGVLLRFFKHAGMDVLGVDPARAIAARATETGIETWPDFFDEPIAQRIRTQRGKAAIVAANNVFAHADDLHGIIEGVRGLLAEDGIFVFEVSYLVDVLEKTLFDTIYHEHLSYHSVRPLVSFFERHGMELIEAQRVPTHGGSLRGIAQLAGGPRETGKSVEDAIALEERTGVYTPDRYARFFETIQQRRAELTRVLDDVRGRGRRVAGFGAPAKATTLMHHFGLGRDVLDYIVDDSPIKQGLFTPGLHIPVVPSSHLYDPATRPDCVLILAWNFADPIMRAHREFAEAGGRFIIPLPDVEIH